MKNSFAFKKWMAVAAVFVLIILLIVTLVIQPWKDKDENSDIFAANFSKLDTLTVVSYAVDKAYNEAQKQAVSAVSHKNESQGQPAKNAVSSATATTSKRHDFVRYEFDVLQVHSAIRFVLEKSNIPFVDEVCGQGQIEVFVASIGCFSFENAPQSDDNGAVNNATTSYSALLYDMQNEGELLIVFRGEYGVYSCITNGGGVVGLEETGHLDSSEVYAEFSSHKYLNDDAVEKDFTPPIHRFRLSAQANNLKLTYKRYDQNEQGDNLIEGLTTQSQIAKGGIGTVASGEIYSMVDLVREIEQINLQTQVLQIVATESGDVKAIIIEKIDGFNLETVFLTQSTVIVKDGTELTIEQLLLDKDTLLNMKVTVVYNKLYSIHNPKYAWALTIIFEETSNKDQSL